MGISRGAGPSGWSRPALSKAESTFTAVAPPTTRSGDARILRGQHLATVFAPSTVSVPARGRTWRGSISRLDCARGRSRRACRRAALTILGVRSDSRVLAGTAAIIVSKHRDTVRQHQRDRRERERGLRSSLVLPAPSPEGGSPATGHRRTGPPRTLQRAGERHSAMAKASTPEIAIAKPRSGARPGREGSLASRRPNDARSSLRSTLELRSRRESRGHGCGKLEAATRFEHREQGFLQTLALATFG